MTCPRCEGRLELLRTCSRLRMLCSVCGKEFRLHEIADQIDTETEEMLNRFNAIIYD